MNQSQTNPQRDLDEMVDRLKAQLRILQSHCQRAFIEKNQDFVGEVATKLRLLLRRKGANTPLLFAVAEKFSFPLMVTVPPRPIKREQTPSGTFSFEEHLEHCGYIYRSDAGNIEYVSLMKLILVYCEKMGGAHEDWQFGEWGRLAASSEFTINDLTPHAHQIKYCADVTLDLGKKLLLTIEALKNSPSESTPST